MADVHILIYVQIEYPSDFQTWFYLSNLSELKDIVDLWLKLPVRVLTPHDLVMASDGGDCLATIASAEREDNVIAAFQKVDGDYILSIAPGMSPQFALFALAEAVIEVSSKIPVAHGAPCSEPSQTEPSNEA